eukprot:403347922
MTGLKQIITIAFLSILLTSTYALDLPKFSEFVESNPVLFKKPPPRVYADQFTVFWTDFLDLFIHPGTPSLVKFVTDLNMFYTIPFIAGYVKLESHKNYEADKYTYQNAEITEDEIYTETFYLIKSKIWEVLRGA